MFHRRLFSCGSSARMKQVVSWGLFVKHHKGSSCHKTRKASVCCFYRRAYHTAPSTGDPQPIKKRKRTACKPKAVTLIRSHTVMTRNQLIKSSGKYSNLEKTKLPHGKFYYRYPQGLLSIFAKRERMKNIKKKQKKNRALSLCQASLTEWSKQLKRKATQHLGRSMHPWLWWDKMSSPRDIMPGAPHCPPFISIPHSNSQTHGHVVQNCKGLN